jgi:general secretion pathway protein E
MLLLTGPTGSGKTTTLYAALRALNTASKKIITVEDPVEYQLPGVNQIHARSEIGLDFANALRAMVRQDPDIIMVGEMRDHETASIAVQSALTGHLLLSTLHTNDASSAVTRLLDMGIEDYLLASTLKLVVAQRLLRRLCDACKTECTGIDYPGVLESDEKIYQAKGCPHCHNVGYKGRIAIHEVLLLDDGFRALILQGVAASRLNEHARSNGMQSLFEDGVQRVRAGQTSMAELLRVTEAA